MSDKFIYHESTHRDMEEVKRLLEEIEKLSLEELNVIKKEINRKLLQKEAEKIVDKVKSVIPDVMALYQKAKELDDELGAYIEKHWDDEELRNYWYLISTIKNALYSFLNTLKYRKPFKELIEI